MPDPEADGLLQEAQLWIRTGSSRYDQGTFAVPVEIPVRWTWVQQQSVGGEGQPISITAVVVVDRDVPEGSVLSLLEGTGSPEYMEVVGVNYTPDIRNQAVYRQLNLARYKSSLE